MKISVQFDPKNIERANVPWGPHGVMKLGDFKDAVQNAVDPTQLKRSKRYKIQHRKINLTACQRLALEALDCCHSVCIEIREDGKFSIRLKMKEKSK